MRHFFAVMRARLGAGLLFLLMLTALMARAQAPAWQSVVALASGEAPPTGPNTIINNTLYITASAADASGNVYLVGDFSGRATFGSSTLVSRGSADVFVAKWNVAAAGFVWVQQAGGTGADEATAVAVSGTSVYVAGSFGNAYPTGVAASFGSAVLANAGDQDGFVAKLTDAGATSSFAWAQGIGGTQTDRAEGIAVSGANVYVVGSFGGTAAIGPYSLSSAGSIDAFVARITDQGATANVAWAQRAGGTSGDRAVGVAVSGPNVYMAGEYGSFSADFGSNTLSKSRYADDVFVAKLTDAGSTGHFVWAQGGGGNDGEHLRAIAVSGPNVYIAGSFGLTAAFGPLSVTAVGSYSNLFVAKLTDAGPTGSFGWVQRGGGDRPSLALVLAVQGTSVYLAGGFSSATADFGTNILRTVDLYDIVVAKLTDAGNSSSFVWAQSAGGSLNDAATGLVLIGSTIYVTGYVAPNPTAYFGSLTLTGSSRYLTSFLAALPDATPTATAAAAGGLAFGLAPNPARGATTLTLPAQPGAAAATLTLRDALGRAVRTATVALPAAGLRHELDLSGLAPGLYALQVQAGEATGSCRLLIE